MDLKGKVAIVTGGGTGMGKAIAKLLAMAGTHVVVNYSRSEADAIATAKELETNNVQALPIKADVSSATKAAAPAMRRAGGGAVVNVTSVAGLKVGGSSVAYAVSKAAAIHLTKCLAFALAPEIRVNAVAPGLVVTRWWGHASEEQLNQMRASFPLKRAVEAEEVATAAMELIRNDAMTGQTLAQDAGLLLL